MFALHNFFNLVIVTEPRFKIICFEEKAIILTLMITGVLLSKNRLGYPLTENAITKIPPILISILPQHNDIHETVCEDRRPQLGIT